MPLMDKEAILERIIRFRESLELKRSPFAQSVGIDASLYHKIEKGEQAITEKTVERIIAKYPQLTMAYILHGNNPPMEVALKKISTPENDDYQNVITSITELMPTVDVMKMSLATQVTIYKEREEKHRMINSLLLLKIERLYRRIAELERENPQSSGESSGE